MRTKSKTRGLRIVGGKEGPAADLNTAKIGASKVIRDCVVYVQSMAAFSAGFHVDPTGNGDYCDVGDFTKKANAALRRLQANSPDCGPTLDELFAKSMVLRIMFAAGGVTEPRERAYARFFAAEVAVYCATIRSGDDDGGDGSKTTVVKGSQSNG
jgi:hypothetical protein